jgi:hypothetical protein
VAKEVEWFKVAKQTCGSLQKSVMLLSLDFMPPDQIGHISLNGLRRRVATRDKTQTGTQMHKPSVALDSEHRVSASGAPTLSFSTEKPFVGVSPTLGFWSMRHSAISEDEVDFQEHYVGHFWLV